MLHHISNSYSPKEGKSYSSDIAQAYKVSQSVILASPRSFSDITSPSIWGYVNYETIMYTNLGSMASSTNNGTSTAEFYSVGYDYETGLETRQPPMPGQVHEGIEYSSEGFNILRGCEPGYPFMTAADLENGCRDAVWPCLEHICADRYGNVKWVNPAAANQYWTASEHAECLWNPMGYYCLSSIKPYWAFTGEREALDTVFLSRKGLEYCYRYEGKRAYSMAGLADKVFAGYSASALRHFKYQRRFSIILGVEGETSK